MGRKRRGPGKVSRIGGKGINIPVQATFFDPDDEYVPAVNHPSPQVLLDHEIEKAKSYREAEKAQKARLAEAGLRPYQSVKYKDEHANLIDVENDTAVIEYHGSQYRVKLSDLNV